MKSPYKAPVPQKDEAQTVKLPKSIKVGPYEYKVVFVDRLWIREDARGMFCPAHAEIQLDATMPKQYVFEVLMHEIIEAIRWSYNLNIGHQEINVLGVGLATTLSEFMEFSK